MIEIAFLAVSLIVSIALHEYAHALASHSLGDPTPKMQWRLTPNPLAHIDPIGLLMVFIIQFGWGRPVQVNANYYDDPLKWELIVSLAGPFTNFVLAFLAVIIFFVVGKFGLGAWNISELYSLISTSNILNFWMLFAQLNLALWVFNLLPVPPLDGYRIVSFLNPELGYKIKQNIQMLSVFFIALILLSGPVLGRFISSITSKMFSFMAVIVWQFVF